MHLPATGDLRTQSTAKHLHCCTHDSRSSYPPPVCFQFVVLRLQLKKSSTAVSMFVPHGDLHL